MPGRRSNSSKYDNSRFKQRKKGQRQVTLKFTMALATAGMCCLGGPQRSLFNLLANGNGDETIRSNGDAFRSLGVFSATEKSEDNTIT